jgi:transposase InsO family protein
MREQGLCGRKKHSRRPRTTDSRHAQPVAANLIPQRPAPTEPNRCWLTDITYLQTEQGWLYLAAILDRFSRRIVGWACGPTLHASLVLAALNDALKRRGPVVGLLHHSDRGSQYVDQDYIQALGAAGIERSMSRAGNCYDNAAMESFWSSLKTDTGLDLAIPSSRRNTELIVFDYIETFYNPTRRHSSLGYLSPVAFENQYALNKIKAA